MGRKRKAAKRVCEHCGSKTKDKATVWVRPSGDPDAPWAPVAEPVCSSCVASYRRRRQLGLWVFLVLQVCWLSFFRNGLTVIGLMGAVVGAWSLVHFVRGFAGLVWAKARPGVDPPRWMDARLDDEEMASELLRDDLKDLARQQGKEILALAAKRRQEADEAKATGRPIEA